SERITTAPVSPLGQRLYVRTKNARDVAAPTTIAPDPTRAHKPENKEAPIHMAYAFIYVADAEEGLVMVSAANILDGNPLNNYLKKDVVFNPDGLLHGARSVTVIGTNVYVGCDAGLVVVSVDDPFKPRVTSVLGAPAVNDVRDVEAQFRYAFVADADGVKVLDITNPQVPVPVSVVHLKEAYKVYPARTYAYVAAGHEGLVILDIEKPEQPVIDQVFNAGGQINDVRDVKLGITYTSQFAYLADGHNGLRVVQLTSTDTPGYQGFSPRPTPVLVASKKMPKNGHALAIAEGIDRDRAVDESGNQIAVFGRVGARPLSLADQQKMYIHNGMLWQVSDDPRSPLYQQLPNRNSRPPVPSVSPPVPGTIPAPVR
ncbi:MAG: LVIVD repeat-containing protein, partial [Isosphaeraceae bacterium]